MWLAPTVTALVFLTLGLSLLSAARRTRLTMEILNGALTVRLHGLDALLCLRGRLEIPVAAIERIEVVRQSSLASPGLRLPGASIPGILRAGSFGTGDSRTFWNVRTAPWVLQVVCATGSEYANVILEVAQPRDEARRLRVALSAP